ncbi:predicted protein [Botrytis cinerea T4]|uniref:Uncharacterized protein n=1 Tax=Botryotinia fuckeliana (strain T4) TaxID=999810 RepID=G2XQY9_BOTF4|nr:predicted protein [Botrytis cinerea T4]
MKDQAVKSEMRCDPLTQLTKQAETPSTCSQWGPQSS